MGDKDGDLSDEEIKNNEEYAAGHKAGLEGDFVSDGAKRVFDTQSLWDKGYEEGERNRDGICFLTTACTLARGLPDTCLELTTLREFRDGVLMKDSTGRKAVIEYYHVAPMIVTAINSSPTSIRVWNNVYRDIRRAVHLVRIKDFNSSFAHYKRMVESLKTEFLI